MTDQTVTSVASLKNALEDLGATISERRLRDALKDDRCPQKNSDGEYEVERVHAWLIEQEIVAAPAADSSSNPESIETTAPAAAGEDALPSGPHAVPSDDVLNQRHAPETVVCSWCGVKVDVQTSTGMFQHFKPCPECGHRPPKRVRPQARELMRQQRERERRQQPAVERP